MKKWFAYMLVLAMLLSPMQVSLAEATDQEDQEEVVSAPVEEAAAAAEAIGVEGLTVGYEELPQEDGGYVEPAGDAVPQTDSLARYGILKKQTEVSSEKSAESVVLVAPENGTVLILESGEDWTRVAFNSEYGPVTGYVAADAVAELDAEAVSAFLDAMAVSGECAFYNNDPETPLETLACALPLPAPEADTQTEAEPEVEAEEAVTYENKAQNEINAPQAEMLAAAGFMLSNEMEEVVVGGSCVVSAMDASGRAISTSKLTYASSNDSVATVNAKGVVTGNSAGSASILVTYNGKTLADTIVVPKEPESIHLNSSTGSLGVKEYYSDLAVIMEPAGRDASVTWSSSNTKYVKVNAETGELYGVKTGSATITATTRNGKKATCKVTVKKAPSKVTLAVSKNTLTKGDSVLTKASVGSGTVCSSYTYESSNSRVATVDENGVITGTGTGTATITAFTYNGKKASVKVTVYDVPAMVVFPNDGMTLGVNQTATLSPEAADAQGYVVPAGLTFSLDSGSDVVTLDEGTGLVRAVKLGTAVVRATASNGVSGTCKINVVPAPVSLTLNASTGSIGVKETYAGLQAIMVMSDGSRVTDGEVTWSSSSPRIVTVEETTGELHGVKAGSATITAMTYNGLRATCRVTVGKAPGKITLEPERVLLSAGGMTARLSVTLPKKTACSTFYYRSSNTAVATVDNTGLVTSVGEGRATIVCESYNGRSDSCTVVVYGEPAKVALTNTSAVVSVGETFTLSAVATSASGGETETNLTYYIDNASPNPDCLRIDAATGAITGISAGTALVGVRTHNGITAQKLCTVTVQPAPVALILPATHALGVGEEALPIPAQIRYSDGSVIDAMNLEWTSSKTRYVTVDKSTGVLKGVKKGTANITARTYNGLTATCKVTVTAAPGKLTMSPATLKLAAGGMKFTLQTSLPAGTNSDIYFRSSNTKVATVSEEGVITTVGQGTATIYASTYNNKTAACALTVTGMPAKASFASASVTLAPAQSVVPQVSVTDSNGAAAMADLTFNIVSGSDVIRLDSATGEITALKTGTSVVSVQTHNGVVSSNKLTVVVKGAGNGSQTNNPVVSGGFEIVSDTEVLLGVGMTYEIETYGANGEVTWSTSKKSVAAVSSGGVVTAMGTGSATITGKDAGGSTVTCKVTVKKAPTSVAISPAEGTLYVGSSGTYSVTIPSNCAGIYTFSSSNNAVARVNDLGLVTAISVGTTTIKVTTYNGRTASAKLTVKDAGTPSVPSSLEKLGLASYTNYYSANMTNAQKIEHVIYLGQTQLGMPYIYGGGYKTEHPKGFDCSGFVYWCYYWGTEKAIKLGDSAKKQGYDNDYLKISSISDLKRGDVVCFNTVDDDDLCDHTGIYLGQGYFMHASSAGGKVMISDLSSGYYNRNFSWARRILE